MLLFRSEALTWIKATLLPPEHAPRRIQGRTRESKSLMKPSHLRSDRETKLHQLNLQSSVTSSFQLWHLRTSSTFFPRSLQRHILLRCKRKDRCKFQSLPSKTLRHGSNQTSYLPLMRHLRSHRPTSRKSSRALDTQRRHFLLAKVRKLYTRHRWKSMIKNLFANVANFQNIDLPFDQAVAAAFLVVLLAVAVARFLSTWQKLEWRGCRWRLLMSSHAFWFDDQFVIVLCPSLMFGVVDLSACKQHVNTYQYISTHINTTYLRKDRWLVCTCCTDWCDRLQLRLRTIPHKTPTCIMLRMVSSSWQKLTKWCTHVIKHHQTCTFIKWYTQKPGLQPAQQIC